MLIKNLAPVMSVVRFHFIFIHIFHINVFFMFAVVGLRFEILKYSFWCSEMVLVFYLNKSDWVSGSMYLSCVGTVFSQSESRHSLPPLPRSPKSLDNFPSEFMGPILISNKLVTDGCFNFQIALPKWSCYRHLFMYFNFSCILQCNAISFTLMYRFCHIVVPKR